LAERFPVYELHIRPMFRLLDRQHMLRVKSDLDLWDYDAVKLYAGRIPQRIGGANPTMPTQATGGPWPSEWVALFNRWVAGGCRRLLPGAGKNYTLKKAAGGTYTLSCKVDIPDTPDGDSAAWLETVSPGPVGSVYQLYVYPGDSVPPPTATVEIACEEHGIDAPTAMAGVTVVDANGAHAVQPS
jgi:hypothetical protein